MTDPRSLPRCLRSPGAALLGVLAALSSCDFGEELVVYPEFDDSFSFERGLEEWSAGGRDLFDPAVTWEVAPSTDRASDGAQSVRLRLDNVNDQGKIWMGRSYGVNPKVS